MPNIYLKNKQIDKLEYILQYYKDSMSKYEGTLSVLNEEMPIIQEIEDRLKGKKLSDRKYKKWSMDEKILFKKIYPYLPMEKLVETFHTTRKSIEDLATKLKIKKDKNVTKETMSKKAKQRYDKERKKIVYSNGYKMIYAPDNPNKDKRGRVPEHILIMEKHLGRYLKPTERVIHKDSNKKNNKFQNLKLTKWISVKSLNTAEILSKRKSGVSIQRLKEEYNISNRVLYKILDKAGCVRECKSNK